MCTTPVPSSVVTSSERITRNASPVPNFSSSVRYGSSGSYRPPGQLRAGQLADDRSAFQLALVGGLTVAREDVALAVFLQHGVADVGADRDGLVGRQRPRRRGPGQQPLPGLELEADGDRRVLALDVDVVVHPQLMVGQRSLAAPAVRQHLEALVDQALVPQLLERPHDAFHVGHVERLVVVVEIDPAGLPGDVVAPLAGVAQYRVAARLVEPLEPHRDDLGLAGDAQDALGFDLGRQAVTVPAEPALHPAALHRAEARHDVLDVAGDQVPVVRQAVGKRRPVIEDELAASRALLYGLAEGVVARPSSRGRLLPVRGSLAGRALRLRPGRPPWRYCGQRHWGQRHWGQRSSGGTSSRCLLARCMSAGCWLARSARGRRARSRAGVPRYHLACRKHPRSR